MSKTKRDIRRANYRQFVDRWYSVVELDDGQVGNFDTYHSSYPRELTCGAG